MKSDEHKPGLDVFLRDVSDHGMTVKAMDGLYRHITFQRPGSFVYGFHITTWPGYLCISGDMGCFVFSRLPDMFEFFRGDNGRINPSYWAEKIQATSKHGGHREFSGDLYREAIKCDFDCWDFESDEQKAEAWKAIEDDWDGLLRHADDRDMNHAIREAMDWKCPATGQEFHEFYEHNLEGYTYHFIWCCRAIIWAIEQFDAAAAVVEMKEAA